MMYNFFGIRSFQYKTGGIIHDKGDVVQRKPEGIKLGLIGFVFCSAAHRLLSLVLEIEYVSVIIVILKLGLFVLF